MPRSNSGVGITCRLLLVRQRQQILRARESARFIQILTRIVHVAGGCGMLLRDMVQHLADHFVFARLTSDPHGPRAPANAISRAAAAKFEHLRAYLFQRVSASFKTSIRSTVGREVELEFRGVMFRPQAPVRIALRPRCGSSVSRKRLNARSESSAGAAA